MRKKPNKNVPGPLTPRERLKALEEPGVFEEIPPGQSGGGYIIMGGIYEMYVATKPKRTG